MKEDTPIATLDHRDAVKRDVESDLDLKEKSPSGSVAEELEALVIPWHFKWFALLLTCLLPLGQNCVCCPMLKVCSAARD